MDIGIDTQSGLFIKSTCRNLYENLPELKYDYSDKSGERKPLTNKARKKKKSINKLSRKSRKQNRK